MTTWRGIAWSKWGSIASITSNGTGLELRNLRCHPENGVWGLSEPTVIPQLTNNLDGGPLKHLSWSPTGSELAVIDSAGRVTILQIFSSLNKPMMCRPCNPDTADDLHAVVGCFWLSLGAVPNRPVRAPLQPIPSFVNLFLSKIFNMVRHIKTHRVFGTMVLRRPLLDLPIPFTQNRHFYMSLPMERYDFCGYRIMANGANHKQNLRALFHPMT